MREARFPDQRTLDQIQWDDLHGVDRKQVVELASCGYLEQGEDVVIAGPIGTSKSHLAIALGLEAARRRPEGGSGWPSGGRQTWCGSWWKPGTSEPSPGCINAAKRWISSS